MNDQFFDHCLKKAVEKYALSQAEPDSERLWQRIEALIDTYESNEANIIAQKNRRRKLYLKIAMALTLILTFLAVISFTSIGEALPASFPIRNFFSKLVSDTQMIIQFNTKESDLAGDPQKPDFSDIYEVEPPHHGFIETSFEDFLKIYDGNLYMPAGIPVSRLEKVQYSEAGNLWTIMLDFRVNDTDIIFSQEDIGKDGSYGTGYDVEDTDLTWCQIDGIQFLVYQQRYSIVKVEWIMDDKAFSITGNMPVEETLSLAQSVKIYKP